MVIHVLPGDAQVDTFKQSGIEGEVAVCRECLVDGPVNASDLDDLWKMRSRYLAPENPQSYFEIVVPELEKLLTCEPGTEVNLWFEYELFCQVNMWFILDLLKSASIELYRVAPVVIRDMDLWDGFSSLGPDDLKTCFGERTRLLAKDVLLGAELWDAFCRNDAEKLRDLADTVSPSFPYLHEVCTAALEKETRPKTILKKILATGETDFRKIFPRFRQKAGVYGYGDTQVKKILNEI